MRGSVGNSNIGATGADESVSKMVLQSPTDGDSGKVARRGGTRAIEVCVSEISEELPDGCGCNVSSEQTEMHSKT